MKRYFYPGLIGSLNYLANTKRLDVTFEVRTLCRHNQNPGREYWIIRKPVLRNLKATKSKKK